MQIIDLLKKLKALALAHKFISGIIVVIVVVGGYYTYNAVLTKKATITYGTATATNGTITTSVSGSGQVSASSTISLQFQGSGTLVYLPVQNGQTVHKGQLIAALDTSNAQQSITNDESQLKSAQINLEKLQGSGDLPVPQNQQDATNALNQDYQTGYNTISNVFTDLPSIMTDLQSILYGNTFNSYQQNIDYYTSTAATYDKNATNFESNLTTAYQTALTEYNKNFTDYNNTSRSADNNTINALIVETYNTTRDISQAIKNTSNLIQFYENTLTANNIKVNPLANTAMSTVTADYSKSNSDITSLLNLQNTINSDTEAVSNAGLSLESAQLSVQNAQNSLANDKANLANYYIYAPFDGTLGKISVQVGQQVGSGTSVATILTTQKICAIPLNEVDAAKIQTGQKVVLTFNALPDLTVAGQVATIDPVGTVTSGVVTYNVQISFDTQDARVKSGMSINANIITNVAQDVLVIPNSAIKAQGTTKYVQVLVNGIPQAKTVTVGLSNATSSQILSGLNEGDVVVTQTISSGTTTKTTGTSGAGGAVRIPGVGGGFGGNAVRIGGGG